MAERPKFASIALGITLFISQAAAVSGCRIPMLAMHEMAMDDVGMVANVPSVNIQQGPTSNPCCAVFAGKAPAVSMPPAPEHGATNTATPATLAFEVQPTSRKVKLRAQPNGSGSFRAILCVFLI
jgi:hypothetical protein